MSRAPDRHYVTWLVDSARWDRFVPRAGDVVVATYPKSGTTWVQRLVSLLVRPTTEAFALDREFPWWEYRLAFDIDALVAHADAMTGRRCFKSHIPFDGLVVHDEVRYIHVVRDPRDVALSYHNHTSGFTAKARAEMDAVGLADPRIGRPYPPIDADPAAFFHRWLTEGALPPFSSGTPFLPYIPFEQSYLAESGRDNLLIVHYADLKRDLVGEMGRIARFLGVDKTVAEITALAAHGEFSAMRKDGAALIPGVVKNFEGGAERLFHSARQAGWRGVFAERDLAEFDRRLAEAFSPGERQFLMAGRLAPVD